MYKIPEKGALNTAQSTKGLETLSDHKAAPHSSIPLQQKYPLRFFFFSVNDGYWKGEDDTLIPEISKQYPRTKQLSVEKHLHHIVITAILQAQRHR